VTSVKPTEVARTLEILERTLGEEEARLLMFPVEERDRDPVIASIARLRNQYVDGFELWVRLD